MIKEYFFAALCLCAVLPFIGTAWAVDYTTLGSQSGAQKEQSSTQNADKKDKEKCEVNDKHAIKKMNKKVAELRIRHRQISLAMKGVTTEEKIKSDDGEALVQEIQEVTGFFQTDEYKAMRPVYKRCNMTMPDLLDPPFWQPF